jgi:hypothetical protein
MINLGQYGAPVEVLEPVSNSLGVIEKGDCVVVGVDAIKAYRLELGLLFDEGVHVLRALERQGSEEDPFLRLESVQHL